jgi:hypothetical protein
VQTDVVYSFNASTMGSDDAVAMVLNNRGWREVLGKRGARQKKGPPDDTSRWMVKVMQEVAGTLCNRRIPSTRMDDYSRLSELGLWSMSPGKVKVRRACDSAQ